MSQDAGYTSQQRPEMHRLLPLRRSRVLEVGCAEGRFLEAVDGVEESWGVEPSPAAEAARARLTRVFRATFDEAAPHLPLAYFDVVVCNDVIEHMTDHDAFLHDIKKHIAPGGVIVGSIPNVRFFDNLFKLMFEKDWHYMPSGILDRTHLRFFTERSLKQCLCDHGYRIEAFEGLNRNMVVHHSRHDRIYRLMARALIMGSAGYFSDIQYLQFGFRAQVPG